MRLQSNRHSVSIEGGISPMLKSGARAISPKLTGRDRDLNLLSPKKTPNKTKHKGEAPDQKKKRTRKLTPISPSRGSRVEPEMRISRSSVGRGAGRKGKNKKKRRICVYVRFVNTCYQGEMASRTNEESGKKA